VFFSPKAFISTMKGQGMLGPILTALGIEPVQFLSEAETMKMISTESKVFSIYADGVVPGYRRETRVRVHAVVDFRMAPAPGYGPGFVPPGMEGLVSAMGGMNQQGLASALGRGQQGFGPGAGSGSSQFGAGSGETMGQNAIQGALVPSPGGTIIYWRVE